jgi:peroxiredoxin
MSFTTLGFHLPSDQRHRNIASGQSFRLSFTKSLAGLYLLAAVLFSTVVEADQPAPSDEVGLRIGQLAPAFTLKDQFGKDVSLNSLLKNGPVALVFFRSADWCLSCELQLVKLQRNLKAIADSGGQLVGISYDPPKTLKCFADKKTITIPILSDTDSKTIDAYGVRERNEAYAKNGVASHITLILDQKGVVRAKMLGVIYDERSGVNALVKALKEAQNVKGETIQ